ncbi:hypothetical protein ABZ137_39855 [Streptomyces bobili]|uniref:hypothetical protein n=1 Tax=Streptomyces bobili TaxID=67280 RepID=UPI0033A63159
MTVTEFGQYALLVEGVEARLRVSRSLELVSYLSSRGPDQCRPGGNLRNRPRRWVLGYTESLDAEPLPF